jgi:hypothetical protein
MKMRTHNADDHFYFRNSANITTMFIHDVGFVAIGGDDSGSNLHYPMGFDGTSDLGAYLMVMNERGGNSKSALLSVMSDGQGDGVVFVGQSTAHGGGIAYRGDATDPSELDNLTSDHTNLFRTTVSVNHKVMSWAHNSNNVSATGTITQSSSDIRLKENIVVIGNAINKIKQVRGVTYDWKDKVVDLGLMSDHDAANGGLKNQIGVLAQELEAVLPELIHPAPFDYKGEKGQLDGSGGGYKTVEYDNIVPLLIEGIKEQQITIEALEARITALES